MANLVRLLVLGGLFFSPAMLIGDDFELRSTGPNTLGQRVDVDLEIRGNVSAEFDGESATNLPLEVDGNFIYRERQLRSQKSTRHIREYETASAKIDYGRGKQSFTLARGNEWLIADRRSNPETGKRVRYLTSTSGLKQGELDLLTIPASTLVWDRMLETTKVAVHQKWTPNDDLLADVLTIDKLQTNEVQLELTQVERGVATIRITGAATGIVDDAETEIQVQGTCEFDLSAGYTRQLRLTLQENRTICESAPGFDAVVKLEMHVDRPSDDILPQTEIESTKLNERQWTDTLVLQNATNDFRLRYDRRWHVIADQDQKVVLRFIDANLLLGQCAVQYLTSLPSPDAYTLEDFRRDVAKTTETKGQLVGDDSFTTDRGQKVMQIDVKGKVDAIDVTWRYYHLAQPDGQRLSLVVTFDTEIAARFEGVDRRLIDSIEFLRASSNAPQAQNASSQTTK